MKASELKELNLDGLQAKLSEQRRALFDLRFQMATGQLTNKAAVKEARKDIARILTVINEKESAKAE